MNIRIQHLAFIVVNICLTVWNVHSESDNDNTVAMSECVNDDWNPSLLVATETEQVIYYKSNARTARCQWLIQADDGCDSVVNVILSTREEEKYTRSHKGLRLYDGISDNTPALHMNYGRRKNFTSSGQFLYISYLDRSFSSYIFIKYRSMKKTANNLPIGTTDNRFVKSRYQPCIKDRTGFAIAINQPNMFLSSRTYPVYPQPYDRNLNCSWLLISDEPCSTVIKIEIEQLVLENNMDFLQFYDGKSMKQPLLASFTGNATQGVLFSSGQSVLVVFNSSDNAKSADLGYAFTYESSSVYPVFLRNHTQVIEDSEASITVYFTSAYPPTFVVWLKHGDTVFTDPNFSSSRKWESYDPGQLHQTTLRLTVSDTAFTSYKVLARNKGGFGKQNVELDYPSSEAKIGNFTVRKGKDSISVQVLVTVTDKTFTVKWYKDETELNDTNKYEQTVSKGVDPNEYIFELRISSLTAEDFTSYQMTVLTKTASSRLYVPVDFSDEYLPSIHSFNTTVERDAVIIVSYHSYPNVENVTWYRGDTSLTDDTKYSTTSRSLKIKDVTEGDFRRYRVSITNAAGTVSRNIELNKPTVFPTYTTCKLSDGAHLTCEVDSCNTVFLPWIHSINGTEVRRLEGVVNGNVNTLTLPLCVIEDLGHYTCVTEVNMDGVRREVRQNSVFVDPQVAPVIGRNIEWRISQGRLHVTARVYSKSPVSLLKWTFIPQRHSSRIDVPIDSIVKNSKMIVPIRGQNVTLSGLQLEVSQYLDEYGYYELRVGNDIGMSEYTWRQDYQDAGVPLIQNGTNAHFNGGTVSVVKRFKSSPPYTDVVWSDARTGEPLNDPEKYQQYTYYSGSDLVIKNVTDDDYKLYKISVRNEIGYSESYARLANPNEGAPSFHNYSRFTSDDIVTFEVNFTSIPRSRDITWYKGSTALDINMPQYFVNTMEADLVLDDGTVVNGFKTVLTIRNAAGTESKNYKVRLSNRLGYTEVNFDMEKPLFCD